MKPYGFAGSWQRFERASEHLAEVRERAALYHAERRDVGDPIHPNDPEMILRRIVEIPERISIVSGEVIYNLRASLDYLVFALSWHDEKEGRRPTGAKARALQFPIYTIAEKFDNNAERLLPDVSPEHVIQIRTYQPFSGCDWIADLADLSNEDKHRHLLWLIGLLSKEEEWEHRWWTRDGELVPKSDLTAFDQSDLLYEDVAHVQVALDDGRPLVETLERLVSEVEAMLRTFAGEFRLAPLRDEEEEWGSGVR